MIHGTMRVFVDTVRQVFGDEGPKVILDVGSRTLDDSITMSQQFPNARVIAFEPNPDSFNLCYEKSKNYKNVEVHECALSNYEGESDFYVVGLNDGGSSLLEPIDVPYSDKTHRKIIVKVRRLDNILKELNVDKVDAVWIDVQGVELLSLMGLGDYLNAVKVIHTEASPRAYYKEHILKDQLENFLKEKGFTWQFYPASGHPYGEGDFVCVRVN